ncbi:hypothetical protein ACFVUS_17895 [Nocardia sp. NPDC058058]|uniref:hypothetical protein n=1 Tax=Nocardia sp. NPDC058058 TaxID=3346317 RepID=UPI0036D9EC95
MPSVLDLLLHPTQGIDLAHQIAHQLIAGNWSTGDWNLGSSFPPSGSGGSGSGTGSGIGNCMPTGSVSLSGGMDCSSGSGFTYPPK